MRRIFSRDTVESLYPLYQYFLGIITFGAYNQYRATKIMESNQKTQQLQFMEKMETLHHMEMIEFDKKLNELREKIRVLEQKRHGWWASLTA
jgi:hypothetical protein